MKDFLALPAAHPLLLFSVLLVWKMFGLAFGTALTRAKAKVVVNPEDMKVNPGSQAAAQEAEAVLRVKRAHLNDLENIPAFMVLATLFTLSGASATEGWAYFGVYFVARLSHSICYLAELQPWRTASFGVGQLTMFGVAIQLLLVAFR